MSNSTLDHVSGRYPTDRVPGSMFNEYLGANCEPFFICDDHVASGNVSANEAAKPETR